MNALAYCAEIAGARRRIGAADSRAASEPYAPQAHTRARRPYAVRHRPRPSKKSHIFPLEAFDHAFMRFFLIVTNPY